MRSFASLALLTVAVASSTQVVWSRTASAQNGPACVVDPAQVPRYPIRTDGSVVRLATPEQARAATEWIERKVGSKINPDYADLPRVVVRIVRGHVASETLAAVVDGHLPRIGDHVEILSRYRDPRSRCTFIPWTVGSIPAVS